MNSIKRIKLSQSGDTLIEVLLSLTLLSLILFTSWAIVNRSSQISLASRKRVVMVNQLKEQAEILKSLYATNKTDVTGSSLPTVSDSDIASNNAIPADPCGSRGSDSAINPDAAFHFSSATADPSAGVKSDVGDVKQEAVWIQANGGSAKGYIDFYIRSCWVSGSGAQQKDDSSQIIVRLNMT